MVSEASLASGTETISDVKVPASTPRVLSGVQPTGNLHLGNYLGAVRQWVDDQEGCESFFSVVDMHAITTGPCKGLRQQTVQAAAMYLACGIDPAVSTIFVQSQVAAHSELMWLLSCVTPHGWLNRMIQFKEKSKNSEETASLGLFAYPVLQAADILLYNPDIIPVGEDQRQHVELARNIAERYNNIYCSERERKTFKVPQLKITTATARVMGLDDASRKMSKSHPNDNSRINLTDSPDVIARKIKKCKTDSGIGLEFDNPDRPECTNLLSIYAAATGMNREQVEAECAHMNWGTFKPVLAEALVEHLRPIGEKYNQLLKDKSYVAGVLEDGYEKANRQAFRTLDRVKKDVGFLSVKDLRKMNR